MRRLSFSVKAIIFLAVFGLILSSVSVVFAKGNRDNRGNKQELPGDNRGNKQELPGDNLDDDKSGKTDELGDGNSGLGDDRKRRSGKEDGLGLDVEVDEVATDHPSGRFHWRVYECNLHPEDAEKIYLTNLCVRASDMILVRVGWNNVDYQALNPDKVYALRALPGYTEWTFGPHFGHWNTLKNMAPGKCYKQLLDFQCWYLPGTRIVQGGIYFKPHKDGSFRVPDVKIRAHQVYANNKNFYSLETTIGDDMNFFIEDRLPDKPIHAVQPRSSSEITILQNEGFVVGYCEKRHNPVWVAYRLFEVKNPGSGKRPSRFKVDQRTESMVSHDAYTRSGYDRGQMAPNYAIATRYGRKAQLQTFLMSNICPRKPNLNRQTWRMLEQKIAKDYANQLEEVWVITGPIFDGDIEKLNSGVEIPDAFYKIVVCEDNGKPRMLAFVIPQRMGSSILSTFLVSVDKVEELTGLDFFSELEDELENRLEAETPMAMWYSVAVKQTATPRSDRRRRDRVSTRRTGSLSTFGALRN